MDEQQIAVYEARIEPIRDQYRLDAAATEARWGRDVQALVDRVSHALHPLPLSPGWLNYVASFDHPLGAAFMAGRQALLDAYQAQCRAIQREVEACP